MNPAAARAKEIQSPRWKRARRASPGVLFLFPAVLILMAQALLSGCKTTGGTFEPLRGYPAPARGDAGGELLPESGVSGTFSIVAVDPQTGIFGTAVASSTPSRLRRMAQSRADRFVHLRTLFPCCRWPMDYTFAENSEYDRRAPRRKLAVQRGPEP